MSADRSPGLEIRVRRVPGPPVVAVRGWVRGGARSEPIPGLALLAGRALTEGSARRDGRRIVLDAETVGAELAGGASLETHGLRIDALARDAERTLEWAAELLFEPVFPEPLCRRAARRQAAELTALGDRPEVRTANVFLDQLYAPHPAGRPLQGDAAGLERLAEEASGEICAGFHRRTLGHGLVLTVAGAIDEQALERRARELFESPRARLTAASPPEPPVPAAPREERRTVALPPGGQAHLFAGRLTVPRGHPDRSALELLAVVLGWGGGLAGRLPERLRHREALAYAVEVRTLAEAGIDPGRLVVYAGTAPEHLARAERAIREELERVAAGDLEERELEEARSYLLGRLPFRFETAGQWAEALGDAALYRRPEDDPGWHARRLRAVTLAEIRETAHRHLDPRGLCVTVGAPNPRP